MDLKLYLIFAFIIMVMMSPFAWLQSSPREKRQTAFRQRANTLQLKVEMVVAVDADSDEKSPSAIRYFRPFLLRNHGEQNNPQLTATNNTRAAELANTLGAWILLRESRRGWPSAWSDWRWFKTEASDDVAEAMTTLLAQLPTTVYAIKSEAHGIGFYLRENGEVQVVDQLAEAANVFITTLIATLIATANE